MFTPCEERDASGTLVAKFFVNGQQNGSAKYFYSRDHVGSVREMADSTGVLQAQYGYDPFGKSIKLQETTPSDFQYASYLNHSRSSLHLTVLRPNAVSIGRWLNREPRATLTDNLVELNAGTNLFSYVRNMPLTFVDPLGLKECDCRTATCAPPVGPETCGTYNSQDPADYFHGLSENYFCKCGGNSAWANQVRACLQCEQHKGDNADKAHDICLGLDGKGGVPGETVGDAIQAIICGLQTVYDGTVGRTGRFFGGPPNGHF